MTYTKEQVLAILGKDELESPIVKPKRGRPRKQGTGLTVTIIYEDAIVRNELRAKQRARLEKYEMGMKAADESSRAQREMMKKKPKKTREVIKYC